MTDSHEYEAATIHFYRRHICRLDPWPDPLTRTFAQLDRAIYERTQGPNEFTITGIHKDYDATDRLGELAVPTLFLCGRHHETRPEETSWYHSLVPGAELVVFEQSSHVPHLEEPELYLQVLRDFLRRVEGAVSYESYLMPLDRVTDLLGQAGLVVTAQLVQGPDEKAKRPYVCILAANPE
jgi:proline iminopeptidase